MSLVLVGAVGVAVWLSIVVIAVALCRAAARADARAEGVTSVAPVRRRVGSRRIPAL